METVLKVRKTEEHRHKNVTKYTDSSLSMVHRHTTTAVFSTIYIDFYLPGFPLRLHISSTGSE